MKPIHRDDLDPEMLAMLQEKFPGFKIICAGDLPEDQITDRLKDAMAKIETKSSESVINGTCIDCGAVMPNYPPDSADWEPAEDWRYFTAHNREDIVAWQCPECDNKDSPDGIREFHADD